MKIKLALFAMWLSFAALPLAMSQNTKGSISGTVVDVGKAVLQGARVELTPGGNLAVSDNQGEFRFANVTPGAYSVAVTFVGFAPYSANVTVTASQTANVVATLAVSGDNQSVLITATRAHGEAEAINRELSAENILQVLPHDIITSLPNANVADAIGRLPSVTLERDEGEGMCADSRHGATL